MRGKLRLILSICIILATLHLLAQDNDRKHSLGFYQNFTDYNVELLNNKLIAFDSSLSLSTRVAYQRRLSRNWMLNAGINQGFIQNQSLNDGFVEKAYALGTDVNALFKLNNGRIIKEDALIGPYFLFGYRADYVPTLNKNGFNPWLFHNQYGAGLNVRLTKRTHLQLQTAVDQKLKGDFNTHFQHRVGFTQSLGRRLEPLKPKPEKNNDFDGDGIVNSLDQCPYKFGVAGFKGCPDTSVLASVNVDSLLQEIEAKVAKIKELLAKMDELNNGGVVLDDPEEEERKRKAEEEKKRKEEELKKKAEDDDYDYDNIPLDKFYYAITWSSPNLSSTRNWLAKMKKDFPESRILPQPNGYYRVGVFAGKSKKKGLELLDKLKEKGYKTYWLSIE